jgi:hypothetical protein
MIITWPTAQDTEVVDAIRNAIGRETIWYVIASSVACSICSLDPVTGTSTNSFCELCEGNYWIPTYSGVTISGHVNWGASEQLGWVTGGEMMEGDCRVQIKYTPDNLSTVNDARYVMVDGRRMDIVKRIYRGVQSINRILVDLTEDELGGEEKGAI